MLEVYIRVICATVMALTGYYVISNIVSDKSSKMDLKSIVYIFILIILNVVLYQIQYTILYIITVFLLNIIVYRSIFKINLEEGIVCTSIFMIILFSSDLITSIIFRMFFSIEEIRNSAIISVITNVTVGIISLLLINIKLIKLQSKKFYKGITQRKAIVNTIFLILLIIYFSCLAHNITSTKVYSIDYLINIIIMVIFIIITYIFIKNKNKFNQLSDEYDSLFSYVQNFEEWIEKEQLNRHEYKNQLAVLRCLTKEKKVKDKIDEILEDSINIEGEVVHQLKILPKGGIKGLMYYKSAIAQKNKINLTVDVSIERKSILDSLSEKDVRVLCKLIGIYFDNAIEAARETRKKAVLIEVYELKDKVNFVFSNTFKKPKNFDKRNEKGVSSKGEGHGNGLYFAKNLISKNEWLSGRQDIIDGYYIQELSIKKLEK